MKKYILFASVFSCLTQISHSQNVLDGVYVDDTGDSRKNYSQEISRIDQVTADIKKNLGDFRREEKFKSDSGYRYVFLKNEQPQLVTVDNFDAQGIHEQLEYYFFNNQVIYAEQIWTNVAKNLLVDSQKFYFYNEHLFTWIRLVDSSSKSEMKDVDSSSEEFISFASTWKNKFAETKGWMLK